MRFCCARDLALLRSKGPQERGGPGTRINRRDRLSSDRRQNRLEGPAEQKAASELEAISRYGDISVLETGREKNTRPVGIYSSQRLEEDFFATIQICR